MQRNRSGDPKSQRVSLPPSSPLASECSASESKPLDGNIMQHYPSFSWRVNVGIMLRNPNLARWLPHVIAGRPVSTEPLTASARSSDAECPCRCVHVLADVCCPAAFGKSKEKAFLLSQEREANRSDPTPSETRTAWICSVDWLVLGKCLLLPGLVLHACFRHGQELRNRAAP